ncbi:MAG: nucleotide exchange factor GrpE [Gammaproteobacteria bacterium]|nr:nucleotide exchange factor GrpE [Gammaproteobacteria bacterium]MYC24922.1 nucleotide exchange factor GrpE [Gammaproteobacteria bacterium]
MARKKKSSPDSDSPEIKEDPLPEDSTDEESEAEVTVEIVTESDEKQEQTNFEHLQARIDELEPALEEARAYALRAHSETENVRRRMDRELEKAHKYALSDFAQALLSPLDTFDIALQSAKDSDVSDQVIQGFELSVKSLADALEKFGIVSFDPHGEVFDPEKHKAMTYVPHPDAEPGSVIEVFRKGYMLHDRLIRGAEVVVAKEPESPEEEDS